MRLERSSLLATWEILLAATCCAFPLYARTDVTPQRPPATKLSHVRVVRLSFAQGTVTVRRVGSSEWTNALVNSPIQEGFSLATGKQSYAEVQFENGSTVRLGELSGIDFNRLALTPEGGHINHMTLDRGYATFHFLPERFDEYLVNVSWISVAPRGKAEFRADLAGDQLRVEVFDGRLEASGANHAEALPKTHALTCSTAPGAPFQLTDSIQKDDWDKWTAARERQSALAANEEAVGAPGPLYGWDDLDVYGEWSFYPGYGNGWAPYAAAGWSPYSAGMWDWYGGMGYTWISAEPWGWLPFHYGFWNFDPEMGWFWMPGSFAAWSPALVNWYSGPGWLGWAPVGTMGIGGAAPCTLAVAGCLTAVAPGAIVNREPLRPGSPLLVHPDTNGAIAAIAQPDVAPNLPTANSREALSRPENSSGIKAEQIAARSAPAAGSPAMRFTRGREAAPSSILMGREISPAVFLGTHSPQADARPIGGPIRVRLGDAVGGRQGARSVTGRGYLGRSGGRSILRGPQVLSRVYGPSRSRTSSEIQLRGEGGFLSSAHISGGPAGQSSHGGSTSSAGSAGTGGGGHH